MKALTVCSTSTGPGLELSEVGELTPGPGELLVEVHASALNRADWLQIQGKYPPPPDVPQDIPGLEYAGTVRATGSRVRRFRPGDRVMGLVGGGAFAERLLTHEREALSVPENLDLTRAAAIPEAFLTAFDALVIQGGLSPYHSVLVHAAASGVGTAALQLIHAAGARAIGTGRDGAKLQRCTELAPVEVLTVDRGTPRFADRVLSATGDRGVDLVLDLVGGRYLPETLRCIAPGARIVLVGTLDGSRCELDIRQLMGRRARLVGTVLRSRPLEEKIQLAQTFEARVLPGFAAGTLRPVVETVLPVTRIAEGFDRMKSDAAFGKIVVSWR